MPVCQFQHFPRFIFVECGEIISQTVQCVNKEWIIIGQRIYFSLEAWVGRVINPESVGKERTQLTRAVALALRELMQKSVVDDQTRDLAAFIVLALKSIYQTIDITVAAWEKRDYWIKADRFRMEWAWSESLGAAMGKSLLADDWDGVAMASAQIMQKLKNVAVPKRHRLGTPWTGAWERLSAERMPEESGRPSN
jgi:hypothetical protein